MKDNCVPPGSWYCIHRLSANCLGLSFQPINLSDWKWTAANLSTAGLRPVGTRSNLPGNRNSLNSDKI